MSRKDLANVVKRAIGDAAFRRQLQSDPQGALKGFDLNAQERAAISSGDPTKLTALGVDQRMSKSFTMADPAVPTGLASFGTDLSSSSANAFIDPGIPGTSNSGIIPGVDGRLSSVEDPGMPGAAGGASLVDNAPFSPSRIRDAHDRVDAASANTGSRLVDNPPFATNLMRDAHDRASTGSTSAMRDAHDRDTTGLGRDAAAGASGGTQSDAFLTEHEWNPGAVDTSDTAGKGASLIDNPPFGEGAGAVETDTEPTNDQNSLNYP